MTSPASLSRLGTATLLAAATLLGTTTGTLGDPATACAEPKDGFNDALYEACISQVEDDWAAGKLTNEQKEKWYETCCITAGGELVDNLESGLTDCDDPNAYPAPPVGQLPRIPGPTEATRVPPPPVGPVITLPGLPPVQTR